MKRVNLEDHVRKEMRNRKIRPSENAWEKLENRLDAENHREKRSFGWYAAAAVAVVAILGSLVLNNRSDVLEPVNELVEIAPKIKIEPQPLTVPVQTVELAESDKNSPEIISDTKTKSPIVQSSEAVAENLEKTQEINDVVEPEIPDYADEKAMEVAAEIERLFENNEDVSLDEVDALLENARRDIVLEKSIRNSKTDAMALLNEVEWELDKTFYDKVFYALGENFKKLANVYAERNK